MENSSYRKKTEEQEGMNSKPKCEGEHNTPQDEGHHRGKMFGKPSGGNEMSEQKMMDLWAQGYSIKEIAEILGMDEDFV